ncbi:MAG: tRNA 2-thiouridine(34) synthase MnmA [Phycisphaerales bacterium]|nr:tRNA 2-thiouridine(34) synthase MnmA [Phycisphaerales bacterium]
MSGGVDSSVAAALLVRAGFDVIGCFMRLGEVGDGLDDPTGSPAGASACESDRDACAGAGPAPSALASARRTPLPLAIRHRGCCSVSDAADARSVAAQLGIPFYVCNFKRDFGRVIDYFVDEYAQGRTPNPCVRCNDWLKFGRLHDYARDVGAAYIASGHYARVKSAAQKARADESGDDLAGCVPAGEGAALLRGSDLGKDQSYVLFGVPRAHLSSMLLPVGHLPKPRVRDLAREIGLPVYDKPDSQEICFVPDDDYAGLVERRRPEVARPGAFVDPAGHELGRHAGQHRFTVGQRKGLGDLGARSGESVFVLRRDAGTNTVVVGPRAMLGAGRLVAHEVNWLRDPPRGWFDCDARIRHGSQPVRARACALRDAHVAGPSGRRGRVELTFVQPQEAVAPGQAVVLYEGERVIGGGWIAEAAPERQS